MKLFIISDPHCGKYNNETEKWLVLNKAYFYEWLIPTLKKYSKKGDKLCILGDIFDNRTSLNLKIVSFVVKLFEDLAKVIEVHSLLGNHDMFAMSDPEINSTCTIRNIPNVTIYEHAKVITLDNKEILMMPWVHGKNKEKEILEQYKGLDLLMCHSDLNGCRTQLYPTRPHNREILDINDFKGFKRVYSGHIHIQQTINNFTFVGCPYHLDRNDIGNEKGIWVYNTKTGEDIFIENNFSPQFKKIKVNEESDLTSLNEDIFQKDFIDLEISKNLVLNKPKIRLQIEKVANKWKPNDISWIDDIIVEKKEKIIKTNEPNKSIKDWSLDWVDDKRLNEETDLFTEIEFKNKMKQTIEKCFEVLQSSGKLN